MNTPVVGVVGAGVIGTGVAQNLAQTDHRVILLDVSPDILDRARREIKNTLRFQRVYTHHELSESVDVIIDRIVFSTDYHLLADTAIVIENVTEKWEIKQHLYQVIDNICPKHCTFAANTSAIPITRIASSTRRASQVIGMHFMNPVPMKPIVEVIRGYHTSDKTVEVAQSLLERMGKKGITVHDSPGFVSNRVLMMTINEAIFLLQEHVACAEEVDHIFKACFGHKMGPLETADLIGLDTVLLSIEVLYESFSDSKYRPCPLLKKMVNAGLYGRKNGEGFYSYPH
jgi:3-hydroxybutyryl-CoA dehydrogenase